MNRTMPSVQPDGVLLSSGVWNNRPDNRGTFLLSVKLGKRTGKFVCVHALRAYVEMEV